MLTLKDRIILIINGKNDIFFSYNLFFSAFCTIFQIKALILHIYSHIYKYANDFKPLCLQTRMLQYAIRRSINVFETVGTGTI